MRAGPALDRKRHSHEPCDSPGGNVLKIRGLIWTTAFKVPRSPSPSAPDTVKFLAAHLSANSPKSVSNLSNLVSSRSILFLHTSLSLILFQQLLRISTYLPPLARVATLRTDPKIPRAFAPFPFLLDSSEDPQTIQLSFSARCLSRLLSPSPLSLLFLNPAGQLLQFLIHLLQIANR